MHSTTVSKRRTTYTYVFMHRMFSYIQDIHAGIARGRESDFLRGVIHRRSVRNMTVHDWNDRTWQAAHISKHIFGKSHDCYASVMKKFEFFCHTKSPKVYKVMWAKKKKDKKTNFIQYHYESQHIVWSALIFIRAWVTQFLSCSGSKQKSFQNSIKNNWTFNDLTKHFQSQQAQLTIWDLIYDTC